MPHRGTESDFELTTIERLERLGYGHVLGPDLERPHDEVLFKDVLRANLAKRYPDLPAKALDEAVAQITRPQGVDTLRRNMAFHEMVVKGFDQPHESLPWNPLIARVFYRRGIIESWGRGTLKIMELSQQAGLERPEIEEAGGCVSVRFRAGRYVPPTRVGHDLTRRQRRILSMVANRRRVALRDLRERFGPDVEQWAIKDDLALLKQLGLIRTTGRGRGARWFLTEQLEE